MPSYIFFSLIILSPWPIFYSFLGDYSCKYSKFKFIISTKRQLYSYIFIVLGFLVFFSYIFFARLVGQHRTLNLSKLYEISFAWLNYIVINYGMSSLILGSLFSLFWIIWFFVWVRWLTLFLKKLILALYLYFYQYKVFYTLMRSGEIKLSNIKLFFYNLAIKYMPNFRKSSMILYIWPISMFALERCIYRYILLYFWLFDYMINYGNISKVFLILPWYYVYSLLRIFLIYLRSIDNIENWKISDKAYGFWRSIITREELLPMPGKPADYETFKGGLKRFLNLLKIKKL